MDTRIKSKGCAHTDYSSKVLTPQFAAVNDSAVSACTQQEMPAVLELSEEAEIALRTEQNSREEKNQEEKTKEERAVEQLQQMLEQLKESREAAREQQKEQKPQKRLNYNYRKVSGNIMRAKNLNQASNALSSANANLSTLKRKAVTGQYDDDELQIAITHARRMIRTARKKVNHLKYESGEDVKDKQAVRQKENHNAKMMLRRISDREKEKAKEELLYLKKELNSLKKQREQADRSNENLDLNLADMEYLEKKIELLKEGKGDFFIGLSMTDAGTDFSGVGEIAGLVLEGQTDLEQKQMAVSAIANGNAGAMVDVLL